jgi:hypothetical protein
VAVLLGIIVALVTGMLSRATGAATAAAVMRGGVAFAGTVSLFVMVMTAGGLL